LEIVSVEEGSGETIDKTRIRRRCRDENWDWGRYKLCIDVPKEEIAAGADHLQTQESESI
jgi:hypothetical protein